MANVFLSPPWYTFANEIKYTYGESPYVYVEDLAQTETGYVLRIKVNNNCVAQALRNILPDSKEFGGVIVTIEVYNRCHCLIPICYHCYTPETLAKTFCTALKDNPLFVGTVLTAGKVPPEVEGSLGAVVIIINKAIVQFFNDDISDLCSNFNEVAAKVFTEVSTLNYPCSLHVSFSTYDCNCSLQKSIYCPRTCEKPSCSSKKSNCRCNNKNRRN